MKRVLVTGASGFVGRQCVPRLRARGYEVVSISRREVPDPGGERVDLLEPGAAAAVVALVRPTHLLHLAWNAEHGQYWHAPDNATWLTRTIELVEAFVSHGGARVVGVGTCAEYDWAQGYLREQDSAVAPATLYGRAKDSVRRHLDVLRTSAGVDSAWARLFMSYGPHEKPGRLVPSVIRALLDGEPARCSSGEQLRDFLHVADVGAGLVSLLDSPVQGAVNIASGVPVSVGSVARRIGELMGRPELIRLGALPTREGDPSAILADVTRLREEVGFVPTHDLDSGLRDAIAYWRGLQDRA